MASPKYISTRGGAPAVGFVEAMLTGLAPDGGLYVPETWPRLDADAFGAMRDLSYAEIAARVIAPFVGDDLDPDILAGILRETYAGFDDEAVAPLKRLDGDLWLMELFHGPTLAFKDYALQLLGRLFDHVLAARDERITIIGATSGDTGSAAIEGCRIGDRMEIFILHPDGGPSEVQRRQMTCVIAPNVHNIALAGSFDDCQDIVKAMFADADLRRDLHLSAVNSINWVRIVAQIVYYVAAAVRLGVPQSKIAFAVPTGNFGNVYAAYAAHRIGLPIERLIIGTNENDILTRTFATGEMRLAPVHPSLSPSMDIQVSSNFERLLFELYQRDGAAVAALLAEFRRARAVTLPAAILDPARELFAAASVDDSETLATMRDIHAATGELIDPHTGVGIAAARKLASAGKVAPAGNVATVALACAHPAKFPEAVARATGIEPALPPRLADLMQREERMTRLANDVETVKDFVRRHARLGAAAGSTS